MSPLTGYPPSPMFRRQMVSYACASIPTTSMRLFAEIITRCPQWSKLLTSLHTLASSPNWMPTMDTGQSSLTRSPACLWLSTVPLEDTISCKFPLDSSVPKTSSSRRWIRSSKSAKDVSELQMTLPSTAALRWNMMPTYETSCRLPTNMTWSLIHKKHMWRLKPSISLLPLQCWWCPPRPRKGQCCTHLTGYHKHHQTQRVLRPSHLPQSLHPWFVHLDCLSAWAAQEGHRHHLELHLQCCFSVDQGSCCQWHHPQVFWPSTSCDNTSQCLTGRPWCSTPAKCKPIAFASKALTKTEHYYANIERC